MTTRTRTNQGSDDELTVQERTRPIHQSPAADGGDSQAPIFILSNFRSGSTLLRYVLDSHPIICSPAELRLSRFCHVAFQFVELTTAEPHESFEEGNATCVRTVRRLVDEVMADYCRRRGKQRWCEKSPGNTDYLHVLGQVFPDGQYLCLHRHCLDQVRSSLDMYGSTRLEPFLAQHNGDGVAASIERWCVRAEKLLAFEHARRHRAIRLTYERFVEAPDRELERINTFLRIDPVPGLVAQAFSRSHDRGPADYKISQSGEIDRKRVGRGRRLDLSRTPKPLLQRMEKLLAVLGYSS